MGFHLDGARLWNALVETKETAKDYGKLFDTISVCFSKGLGCPIGSVLVGDEHLMKNAIRIRKILGGGMRQVGFLAAAALYALDNNMEALKEDHIKAKEIASVLEKADYISKVESVETNIVIFTLTNKYDNETFFNILKNKNIHISNMGQGKLRIVTHLDYTYNMHKVVLDELRVL